MRIFQYSILAVHFFIFAQFTFAQKANDPISTVNPIEYDEITIIKNRLQIPFSDKNREVIILDAKTIESLPVQSLNELLTYIAGVDLRQRGPWGGQADLNINGGTFDQTMVLLNGVKIIDPQTGHNTLNLPVPLDAVDRIEVLKGAAASNYGINAINGIVNIITKQPDESGVIVSLNSGSSFEKDTSNQKMYGGVGINISTSLKTDKTQHFLSLGSLQTTGHRYNTAMNNHKLFYQNTINFNPSNKANNIQMMGGFVYNDFGANGFYAYPGDVESKETVKTGIFAVSGNFMLKEKWRLQPSVSYRYNNDNYIYIRQKPEVYQNIHTTNMLNAIVKNSIYTSIGTIGFGLEYRNEVINSNSLGNWKRDNFGVYSQFSLSKWKKLPINIGAYLNYSEYFGWQLLPSADISYQIHKGFYIFANTGLGTRVPTYTDWYYKGPQNIGNPNLQPENAINTEGGVKWLGDQISANASYFYRITDNVIDWVKDSLNHPWQTQNFRRISISGVSLSIDYDLLKSNTEKGLNTTVGISYTWLEAKIDRSENKNYAFSHYTLENLKNQLVTRIHFNFLKHFDITFAGRYEERINNADYFLIDTKLSVKWENLKIQFSVNNLSDVTYVEAGAYPLPGRWFNLGLTWQWWK